MAYILFNHFLKVILYFQSNLEFVISQLILLFLNIFSSSILHLLEIIERTDVFSKIYDILGFFQIFYTYHKQYEYLWIAASVADAADVDINGIKTVLANGLGTIFIKGNPLFMVLKVYLGILLVALFYATEFLITLQ